MRYASTVIVWHERSVCAMTSNVPGSRVRSTYGVVEVRV
jgi:hypothetical protein